MILKIIGALTLIYGLYRLMELLNKIFHRKPKMDHDWLLWPQYADTAHYYDQRISQTQWVILQSKARVLYKEQEASDKIKAHWKSITEGVVPFGFKVVKHLR